MSKKDYKFDTLQVHAGQKADPTTGARAVPIYQTTSFAFKSFEQAEAIVKFKELGFTYSRTGNPTNDVLEQRIAALEGGTSALSVGSGSAAVSLSILAIAEAGDEIVAASTLYGGTYNLFSKTLPKLGIKVKFVDPDEISNFESEINDNTKAIFIESIGNPGINIVDIEAVAKLAHKNGIPLIVDNTFATPYLLRPIDFGADIVIHSATKFIGGHGTTIGGLIIDAGKFDWAKSGKFPEFTEPQDNYGGVSFTEQFKDAPFVFKVRLQYLRDIGACLSPTNAFILLQGLETLSLRVKRHVENAEKVAEFLENNSKVAWVSYPGLKGNKYNKLAQKYLPKGSGSILTFGLKGGIEEVKSFINSLEIFSILLNVGDAKSLAIHPASTTHAQLSLEQQKSAGITPDLIRLSIGIEDAEDIISDLANAIG